MEGDSAVVTDCYACKVAETHPLTKLRGNADCVSCDARALAAQFGGLPFETVTSVLTRAWPEVKKFREGRSLFWMWAKLIDEAKAKVET